MDNSSKKFYHERTKRVGGSIQELGVGKSGKDWCGAGKSLGLAAG